jgi:hypothetical protein
LVVWLLSRSALPEVGGDAAELEGPVIGLILGLILGSYLIHRKSKALGLDKHPINIAFLNCTANCIAITIILVVLSAIGG